MKTIFYTYLIGWSKHNKWYYGSRTAKKSNPVEFWVTYFTSSKYVKEFRQKNGEPNIIQIRQTFTEQKKCIKWESTVLNRINASTNDKFLNLFNIKKGFNTSGKTHAIDTKTGYKLGLINCNDKRWKTKEISLGIPKHTLLKSGFAYAKDNNEIHLGRIELTDPRWGTKEIVGIRKGSSQTLKQKQAAKEHQTGKLKNKVMVKYFDNPDKLVYISKEEFIKNNNILFEAASKGRKQSLNSVTVYDLNTNSYKNVSCDEYKIYKNIKYLTTRAAYKRGYKK